MSERQTPLKPRLIDQDCDGPGCEGVMRPTGVVLMSNPPQHPHTCTECDNFAVYPVSYPYLSYVGVDIEGPKPHPDWHPAEAQNGWRVER